MEKMIATFKAMVNKGVNEKEGKSRPILKNISVSLKKLIFALKF